MLTLPKSSILDFATDSFEFSISTCRVESGRRGHKSRNFHAKVGKSRNFSIFKVGKSRKFIGFFVTSLHTGTSYMFVSFVDFEANHLFFQNYTFYTQSVAIEEPYSVLLIANYYLRTAFRLN